MNSAEKIAEQSGLSSKGRVYRPTMTFYHSNAKGTGSAAEFELHPAHDDVDGSIMVRLANQSSVADASGGSMSFARFDWENSICIKLDFADLTKMLQVFRGESESLEDGKGVLHRSSKGITNIQVRRLIDPCPGYSFEVRRTSGDGENKVTKSIRIFFRPNEALGLRLAIEGSLSVVCFGIPMVIQRDRTNYKSSMATS